jgi:chromosome segregation ATPase
MEASIEQTEEWFKENMDALRHLEENGFSVQSLRCTLTKLSQIKSNTAHYIEEIDKLEAEIAGKTSSLSRIDELLDEKDAAVAELKQKLGRLRQESQKIAKEKEEEEMKMSNLQGAHSRLVEACGDAEQQFLSVLSTMKGKFGSGGDGSHLMTREIGNTFGGSGLGVTVWYLSWCAGFPSLHICFNLLPA